MPIQYADYALWQREYLGTPLLQTQLDYWKHQLAGELPALQLPTDFRRSPTVEYLGASRSLTLPEPLTTALKSVSRREKVTLFMTLLAAFKTLLHRHTGQEDIVVGTPIAGRQWSQTEQVIGLFVNMLPLRTNLSADCTFVELLASVREVVLGAYAHQDVPFEKLVEELRPNRTLFQNPFFDVVLNFAASPVADMDLPNITHERLALAERRAKYPITLFVREHAGSLVLQMVYQQALFSQDRIDCMLSQLSYLLTQIARDPRNRIGSYSLVTPETKALLPDPTLLPHESWYPAVTVTFEEWVRRMPEQLAVIQGENNWSYYELAYRARTVAQMLLANGLKRGEVVAISGQGSFGFVACLLGTLMSGGVLLTLDPNLPEQRRKLMLQEARARYALVERDAPLSVAIIPPHVYSLVFDKDTGHIGYPKGEVQTESALPGILPEDPAYIFFTSGSTGVPNAVLGMHKGISHFLSWQQHAFDIGPKDRVSQLIGLSFDAILRDILLPLTSGATLCLPDPSTNNHEEHILLWLERMDVTVCHSVPSLAQTWLSTAPTGVSLKDLRWFFLAGEPLLDTFVYNWRRAFPQAGPIVNFYGPTETTMIKCYYILPEALPPGIQPAGIPLPETQALVVREDNEPCGLCEIGEIVIRTPFRTLGYMNSTIDSEKRFARNPFRTDPQDIVYYTGDVGRFDPRGLLEVLGRKDNQLKLWGVRIEPEEIESQLSQHPDVGQAVVVIPTSERSNRYLVAFVVMSQESTTTADELRRFLRQRIPEYMVPKRITLIKSLPLTANGKADRAALAALASGDAAERAEKQEFIAPSTATQQALAAIWQDKLGVRVGVSDSFLDLGGHSLLAAQIIARIRQVFQVELPLRLLFEEHVLGEVADYIDAATHLTHRLAASADTHDEAEREEGEL
ncbi:MAG: amino acid adenylation domain-containing protein [Chloroflexia bacterium]